MKKQHRTILEVLAKDGGWMTRQEIIAITGQPKGYSAAMGAPTRRIKRGTLEWLGYVERPDGPVSIPLLYRITTHGKTALASGG